MKKTNEEGGALYIVQSDKIRIDHCLISNNSCEYEAGGIQIEEGDIFLKVFTDTRVVVSISWAESVNE